MKKLFFTAIVMIAFSSTSASIVEKEELLVSDTPCTDAWSADLKVYQKWGYTFEEALVFADADWEICMDELYGD